MQKYSTFWPRVGANIVDGLIFLPFSLLDFYMSSPDRSTWIVICWTLISYSAYLIYSVTMHAKYGQTVGKKVVGIRVLNVAEDRIPSLRQAALRDIGVIILSVMALGYTLYLIATHTYSLGIRTTSSFLITVGYLEDTWFLLEFVTMLTNKKRRALHDLIAGTVVVHTSYPSTTTVLGLHESQLPPQDAI